MDRRAFLCALPFLVSVSHEEGTREDKAAPSGEQLLQNYQLSIEPQATRPAFFASKEEDPAMCRISLMVLSGSASNGSSNTSPSSVSTSLSLSPAATAPWVQQQSENASNSRLYLCVDQLTFQVDLRQLDQVRLLPAAGTSRQPPSLILQFGKVCDFRIFSIRGGESLSTLQKVQARIRAIASLHRSTAMAPHQGLVFPAPVGSETDKECNNDTSGSSLITPMETTDFPFPQNQETTNAHEPNEKTCPQQLKAGAKRKRESLDQRQECLQALGTILDMPATGSIPIPQLLTKTAKTFSSSYYSSSEKNHTVQCYQQEIQVYQDQMEEALSQAFPSNKHRRSSPSKSPPLLMSSFERVQKAIQQLKEVTRERHMLELLPAKGF